MRHRRLLLGMNQATLSKQLGISFQQLQKYEKGHNRISAASLFELCRANDIDIHSLYQDVMDVDLSSAPPKSLRDDKRIYPLISNFNKISSEKLRSDLSALIASIANEVLTI